MVGLLVTVALTVGSSTSYTHSEQRLTSLQTRLTASVLQTAEPQLQAQLGRIIGLTAAADDPQATFRTAMAPELTPKGPFASATVAIVQDGQVRVLDHVGTAPLQNLTSAATTQLFQQAARTSSLVTTRAVSGGTQKLGYLLSARSARGTYVLDAAQQLPTYSHIKVPAGSPYANLNFALYFGPSATPVALIETNAGHLPLTGTVVAKATVPFGNNVLSLVATPRTSLAGSTAESLPWIILAVGILLSLAAAAVTDNLVRRRRSAEVLYRQQRSMSEVLQHSLLPKSLPAIPGWKLAARYVPATRGAEIGGDWYSVVELDDHRFAMVIGDVSGHDLAAAGVMASLRYSIQTLARLGIPPDEILDRAAKELDLTTDHHFATALVGLVDTRMQEITFASAGHLPPLVLHDGRAEFLKVLPGVPLGVSGGRPQPTTVHFRPGSTLVAFTDGLVEQRGQALSRGLDQLLATAAGGPSLPDDLITRLVASVSKDDHEDDIALLTIHFSTDLSERDPGESASDTTTVASPSSSNPTASA